MEYTKEQLSLLLYLEDCAVNKSGRVNVEHVSSEERIQIDHWRSAGLLEFGRILTAHHNKLGTQWVRLSDELHAAAAAARLARSRRIFENIKSMRTKAR